MISVKPGTKKYEKIFQRNSYRGDRVEDTVRKILKDVQQHGDEAVLRYTRRFDKVDLDPKDLRVSEAEISGAYQNIKTDFIHHLKIAIDNVTRYYKKQSMRSWKMKSEEGVILGERIRPIESVGVYVPSGTAPLPSTVYMTVLPAKLAGVEKVYLITPPNKYKTVDPYILCVANLLKVDGVFKAGGAQAIGAFAYGTKTVPKVDKIIGPGNAYVAEAKRQVFGYCDIDMVAGPTELVVLADESCDADYVACDLMAQSEHHMGISYLVTTSKKLAKAIEKSTANGYVIQTKNLNQAADIVNRIAPEHLQIMLRSPNAILKKIKHAGAIFLGAHTPTALGDYIAGPSHVLPTGGTARFFSGIGISDFMKSSHVISYTRKSLEKIRGSVEAIASLEGLTHHMESVKVRFDKSKGNS